VGGPVRPVHRVRHRSGRLGCIRHYGRRELHRHRRSRHQRVVRRHGPGNAQRDVEIRCRCLRDAHRLGGQLAAASQQALDVRGPFQSARLEDRDAHRDRLEAEGASSQAGVGSGDLSATGVGPEAAVSACPRARLGAGRDCGQCRGPRELLELRAPKRPAEQPRWAVLARLPGQQLVRQRAGDPTARRQDAGRWGRSRASGCRLSRCGAQHREAEESASGARPYAGRRQARLPTCSRPGVDPGAVRERAEQPRLRASRRWHRPGWDGPVPERARELSQGVCQRRCLWRAATRPWNGPCSPTAARRPAPRAALRASAPRGRPSAGHGRLARPRSTTSGS
jgi:hypothetical protein